MSEEAPVVYILYGEDEYSITQFVSNLVGKLGDPSMAEMNITRLDGRSATMEELANAAFAMPFMVKRRLTILTHPLHHLAAAANKDRFKNFLENLPLSTALVLIEYKPLTSESDRKNNKLHWLEEWGRKSKDKALVRACLPPDEREMIDKIFAMVNAGGGKIGTQAAAELVRLVGQDTLLAHQEVHKLLAYVNYDRPITIEDVQSIVEDVAPGNIFELVDKMAAGKGRDAVKLLHKLLEDQEPLEIFGMVIRQFRLLLLAREVIDSGGTLDEAVRALELSKNRSWLARKYLDQARSYTLPDLELIYRRLLDLDIAMKSSSVDPVVALDTFTAALAQPVPGSR